MAENHLISGLRQLRGETLGRIADLDRQLETMEREREAAVSALDHIDGVLLHQDPDIKLETIKARRPKGSCVTTRADGRRVPVTQAVLKLLRIRNVPMSVDDVVECLERDYPSMDSKKLKQNVRMLLSTKKAKGVLQATNNDRGVLSYSFAARPVAEPLKQAA